MDTRQSNELCGVLKAGFMVLEAALMVIHEDLECLHARISEMQEWSEPLTGTDKTLKVSIDGPIGIQE